MTIKVVIKLSDGMVISYDKGDEIDIKKDIREKNPRFISIEAPDKNLFINTQHIVSIEHKEV